MEESLRQQIDRRIEQRVVEEADSPLSFPLVPVSKKNSREVRWLIDHQRQDAITEKDAVPLPNIADNPSRPASGSIFSALDGAEACHEPPASEVLCYPGDTAIHSGDTWGHLRILRKVSIPPGYTSVRKDWPIPDTRKTLRAFLDKCGYYRRFIANCATNSTPKDQRGGIPCHRQDTAAVKTFRTMGQKLMSVPILAYPRFHGKPFIPGTDFSVRPGAIGGVLSSRPDGQEKAIAYGAQHLLPRERSYASTKGELLSVIFVSQYPFLHRVLCVRTGNRALAGSRSRYSPAGRILRWLEILASFDLTVTPGKDTLHGDADPLSRVPHAVLPSSAGEKILVRDETTVGAVLQAPPGSTNEESKEHQEKDDHLRDVQHGKMEPPSETEKQMLSPDQRRLLASLYSLHRDLPSGLWSLRGQEDGVPCDCLYVPHALRHWVLEAAHQFLDHTGINSTSHFYRKGVFMFRLVPEVHRVLQHCRFCQVKSQKAPTPKDVHHPSIQAATPFQVWSMDVIGPVCASSEGHRYLRNWKDIFSQRFEAIPLSHMASEKVLRTLQMLYVRFGYLLQVHTDNATYFRLPAMQEAFQRAGVRLTFTPTSNPQSNSVERTHRGLNPLSRVLCHRDVADREEVLPAALLALRSAVHESLGVTPSACLHGREPANPAGLGE